MISKPYHEVRVGTREEESLETLSEDRERLCRCDAERNLLAVPALHLLSLFLARQPSPP